MGLTRAISRSPIASYLVLQTALALVFFSPALLSGGVVASFELLHAVHPWASHFTDHRNYNPELTDVILQYHPWFVTWADSVSSGELPLWCPSSGSGLPFAANPLTASYFPLTALSLLGPHVGWNLLLMLRFALAGAATFLWLRFLGRSFGASAMGGVAYSCSFPFLAWLPAVHGNVSAFLPLLLLTASAVARVPSARKAAGFGGVLLLMHLGGEPELTFVYAGASTLLVALSAHQGRRLTAIGWLLAGGIAGTLAAGVQIIPFLEYLVRSRAWIEPGHEPMTLGKEYLAIWIAPLIFGRRVERTLWSANAPSFLDVAGYAGASALALALFAVLSGKGRRVTGLLVTSIVVLGVAYRIPPVSWMASLPLFDRAMIHRTFPVVVVTILTLAAFGWDRLRAISRTGALRPLLGTLRAPALVLSALAVAVVGLCRTAPSEALFSVVLPEAGKAAALVISPWVIMLTCRRSERRWQPALGIGLLLLDLWRPAFGYLGVVDAGLDSFATKTTTFLASRPRPARVLPLGLVLPPNTNLRYGIASLLTYDGLDLRDEAVFVRHLGGYRGEGTYDVVQPRDLRNPRVLELLNVSSLVEAPGQPRLDTPAFRAISGLDLTLVHDQPDGRVYDVASAMGPVWFRGTGFPDRGFQRFWPLLSSRDPRASSELYLDASTVTPGEGRPGTARIVRYGWNEIKAEVTAEGRGWVVFAEGFFPGWIALVNGVPRSIVRANGLLRAVPVDTGRSVVILRYRPRSLVWGLALSAIGGALLVGAFFNPIGTRATRGRGR